MQVATVDEAVSRCLEVLAQHPSGVFSDFDGTLSAIAPTPDAAEPYEGATEAVARLVPLVDEFAIITGRAATDAQAKIGVPDIRVIGNHGLEMIENGVRRVHPVGVAATSSIGAAMDEISPKTTSLIDPTGMVFENKAYSGSVHFRNTPVPAAIDEVLAPIVHEVAEAHHLRVTGGKMMYELRPLTVVSKGTALEELVQTLGLKGAIFFGDDVTDVDGFRNLRELRETRGCRTLAFGVMSEETHPSVIEESDVLLSGVADTVQVLAELANRLAASGPESRG